MTYPKLRLFPCLMLLLILPALSCCATGPYKPACKFDPAYLPRADGSEVHIPERPECESRSGGFA